MNKIKRNKKEKFNQDNQINSFCYNHDRIVIKEKVRNIF